MLLLLSKQRNLIWFSTSFYPPVNTEKELHSHTLQVLFLSVFPSYMTGTLRSAFCIENITFPECHCYLAEN